MTEFNAKDYEVGYKRPPTEHQFKPGQSGNPKGRPKLIKDFKTDLREEMEEIITINNGEKITKQRALLKKLLVKALSGELGALKTLTNLIALHLGGEETELQELSEEDKQLLNKYIYKNTKEINHE
ncbi:MAG: DUF5681 domain-containing protein [Candidatus Gastranaerophilales bacterium]|nr:DUF5681 domain-containing protein [Candidatus Gastranaerophilales bacterium]